MRVAFLIEGATEGAVRVGVGDAEPFPTRRAVPLLVARILGVEESEIECFFPPLLRPGAGAILKRAAKLLKECGRPDSGNCQGAVILVDADGKGRQRLRTLRQRVDEVEQAGMAIASCTAVGVAIEKFEAWLLADEGALSTVLEVPNPNGASRSPETLKGKGGAPDDAKRVFAERVAQAGKRDVPPDELAYRIVARMDLDVVERRCPKGFGLFRREVKDKLGSLV